MRKHYQFSLLIGLSILIFSCSGGNNHWQLASPDETVLFTLSVDKQGKLSYKVSVKTGDGYTEITEPSPLGISRTDADFISGLSFISSTEKVVIDETYHMACGNTSVFRDHACEQSFEFRNHEGNRLQIYCRAYNDGVAFRYVFPEKDAGLFEVTGEITGFNLPDSGKAWVQPYDTITFWSPAYEQFFMNGIEIGTTAPANRNGWCFPMLFETLDHWVYISEAGLDTSYFGSHIEAEAPGGLYTIRFPEEEEADNYFPRNPSSTLPWHMPWRYILVSSRLGDIFTSNRVSDLSEPSRLEETTWIVPGSASWSWWSEGRSPRDYKTLTKFVDFAAKMGWRYSLVDAGWPVMTGGDISRLTDYAAGKGVGILLWYDSGGRFGKQDNDQDKIMFYDSTRAAEMKRIADMGVKGVKVDFFQSDKQGMIKLYYDILEEAARNRLVVDFHGCAIPRGWSRTWPNLLTMEAIKGAEAYRFDQTYPDYGPVHNTIIPFTRNVTGPMDYTPVTLSDSRYPHKTTSAHELALAVVFLSGLQHFADHYSMYEALPDLAREYLRIVPVTWDESRLIDGYPGKDVTVARRKGDTWFIAGINGEPEKKSQHLSLSFLEEGTYSLVLLSDGADRDSIIEETGKTVNTAILPVSMNAFGGFAAYLSRID